MIQQIHSTLVRSENGDSVMKDALGYEYDVPDEHLKEFERRRGVLLRIAIFVELLIIAGLIWFSLR